MIVSLHKVLDCTDYPAHQVAQRMNLVLLVIDVEFLMIWIHMFFCVEENPALSNELLFVFVRTLKREE